MRGWRVFSATNRSLIIVLLLALALFYALATGATLYYRIIYLLGIAFAGSYVWGYFNIRGINVEIDREQSHVQAGDTIQETVGVQNTSPMPKAWLEVRELTTMPGGETGQVMSLEGHGRRYWRARLPARQRGVYTLGPVQIIARDPFGLFEHRRVFPGTQEVVVYPGVVDLPHFNIVMSGAPEDGRQRRPVQRPTPHAAGVREYLDSDSLSRIHWPTTARMGKLYVKQFDQGTGNDLWVLVDLDASVQAGSGAESTDEYAVTVAASVALKYLSIRVPVGLVAQGQERAQIVADQSPSHIGRLLDTLARVRADGHTPLAELLLDSRRQFQRNSTLLVVTPSADPTWVRALTPVMQVGTRVAAVLVDPRSFGGSADTHDVLEQLAMLRVPCFVLRQGQPIAHALSLPWDAAGAYGADSPELQVQGSA